MNRVRVLSFIMCVIMLVYSIPITAHAEGRRCKECGDWFNESEVCEYCHMCNSCESSTNMLCANCGECIAEKGECPDHSDENHCRECAVGTFACEICGECAIDDSGFDILSEAYIHKDCGVNSGRICNNCESAITACDYCHLCANCEEEQNMICNTCGECIKKNGDCSRHPDNNHCAQCAESYFGCEICGECVRSEDPSDLKIIDGSLCHFDCAYEAGLICINCEEAKSACVDCNLCENCIEEMEMHCYECNACFEVTERCGNDPTICVEHCILCAICGECFVGMEYMLCPDCEICQECAGQCDICGNCLACTSMCADGWDHCEECCILCECEKCLSELNEVCEYCELCWDCCLLEACEDCGLCVHHPAFDEHVCLGCNTCMEVATICEYCGLCEDCCEANACEDCGLCEMYPGFEEHACENCGGCVEGEEPCEYCGLCVNCCADNGCEVCGMCAENGDYEDHFCASCGGCMADKEPCMYCGLCEGCCETNACEYCGMCVENPDYEDHICENCGSCTDEYNHCPDCGLCENCCTENSQCSWGMCVQDIEYEEHFCEECGECFHDVVQCETCSDNGVFRCEDCCKTAGHKGVATEDLNSQGPKITLQPVDAHAIVSDVQHSNFGVYVSEGVSLEDNYVTFKIQTEETYGVTFQWQNAWGNGNWRDMEDQYNITGTNTNVLKVSVLGDACTGGYLYRCVVSNHNGSTISNAVTIQADHDYLLWYAGAWREADDVGEEYHVLQCVGEGCESWKSKTKAKHTYVWTELQKPTTTTPGKSQGVCTVCHYKKVVNTPRIHDHKWVWDRHKEDHDYYRCAVEGCLETTMDYYCDECDQWSYETTALDIEMEAHNRDTHILKCHSCGKLLTNERHIFGKAEIIREATQEKTGSEKQTCISCGYELKTTIPKLPHVHDYVENPEVVSDYSYWHHPTYNADAHWKICTKLVDGKICGYKYDRQEHCFNIDPATTAPNIINPGQSVDLICYECAYRKTVSAPARAKGQFLMLRNATAKVVTPSGNIREDSYYAEEGDTVYVYASPIHGKVFGGWHVGGGDMDVFRNAGYSFDNHYYLTRNDRLCGETPFIRFTMGKNVVLLDAVYKTPCNHEDGLEYQSNNMYHWLSCDLCHLHGENENHEITTDNDGKAYCEICGWRDVSQDRTVIVLDNIKYELNTKDHTAAIIGNTSMPFDIDVSTIEYNGETFRVTEVRANAFLGCTILESVRLPEVKTIGDLAFACCSNLEAVELVNVNSINSTAFDRCSSLSKVVLPCDWQTRTDRPDYRGGWKGSTGSFSSIKYMHAYTWNYDAQKHWTTCPNCQTSVNSNHTMEPDENNKYSCTECGYTNHGLWIGNKQVTDSNLSITAGNGKVTFDSKTYTLTLNGATITDMYKSPIFGISCGIFFDTDLNPGRELTINLVGNNTIKLNGANATGDAVFGLWSDGLRFTGTGSLTIDIDATGTDKAVTGIRSDLYGDTGIVNDAVLQLNLKSDTSISGLFGNNIVNRNSIILTGTSNGSILGLEAMSLNNDEGFINISATSTGRYGSSDAIMLYEASYNSGILNCSAKGYDNNGIGLTTYAELFNSNEMNVSGNGQAIYVGQEVTYGDVNDTNASMRNVVLSVKGNGTYGSRANYPVQWVNNTYVMSSDTTKPAKALCIQTPEIPALFEDYVSAVSFSLADKIGFHLYTSEKAEDFSVTSGNKSYAVVQGKHRVTVYLDAKEMVETLDVTIKGTSRTFKPMDLLKVYTEAPEDSEFAKYKGVAEALETYCVAASAFFDGDETTKVAPIEENYIITVEDEIIDTENTYSLSLVLESEVALKVYIINEKGITATAGQIQVNDNTVYVKFENIAITEFGKVFEVNGNKFSVLGYIKRAIEQTEDIELANLCKSLYKYYLSTNNL